jgi:hypothetical protein
LKTKTGCVGIWFCSKPEKHQFPVTL